MAKLTNIKKLIGNYKTKKVGNVAPQEQKDWIISNFETGNLLCLTLIRYGKEWYLHEWVNFYQLNDKEMKKMIDMGYHTMLEAAKKVRKYEYISGEHKFNKIDLDSSEYFNSLINKENFHKKYTIDPAIKIDKNKFEKEVNKLNFKVSYHK